MKKVIGQNGKIVNDLQDLVAGEVQVCNVYGAEDLGDYVYCATLCIPSHVFLTLLKTVADHNFETALSWLKRTTEWGEAEISMEDFFKVPSLNLSDIEDWVSLPARDRGYRYYLNGQVLNYALAGTKLTGKVSGTKIYEVEIRLDSQGIFSSRCSCPVRGGPCKHVAAVLYQFVH